MGLKGLFSKEGRKERSLQKACSKATNKKIKPDDRRPALYTLLEAGTDEAITALLRRFTFIYDSNIVTDEEEKNMVYEGLLAMGDKVVPELRRHLVTAPTLSWGLRLLSNICDHDTTWQVIDEVLEGYDAEYERDPTRKLQLMTFLGDFKDPRAVDRLLPFVEDHDETVRFTTVESLFKQEDDRCREPLLRLLTDEDEESRRIRNRIAEGFVETGWTVKGFRGTVEKLVGSEMTEFLVDGKGRIKRRKARRNA